MKTLILIICTAALSAGCASATQHRAAVQDDTAHRVTLGAVQKDIHVGMSAVRVAEILGSPNIVSTESDRNEVWIYDSFATDVVYSSSRGGVLGLVLVGGASTGAGGVGLSTSSAGAVSTSQQTLTVVIKFDQDHRVRDFAYHTARF